MHNRISFLSFPLMILALAGAVSAQTAATTTPLPQTTPSAQIGSTERAPRRIVRRPPVPAARVTVMPGDSGVAPQVVTIVHRLSGVKLLRLLSNQAGHNGVVETIDPQTLMADAHASVIAGWAMDDGKTITARLPQAAAEIESFGLAVGAPDQFFDRATTLSFSGPLRPDLTVITRDGRKFGGQLIGLDAETGLSVLQITGDLAATSTEASVQDLATGQVVDIFAPGPVTPESEAATRNTFVKLQKLNATLADLMTTNSGAIEKFRVRATKLSPSLIGGIACNESGATIGIVESIEGAEAVVVPAEVVRAATQRVLARRASVPRPLLGVRGEPIDMVGSAALLARSWTATQARELIDAQVGILLTSIAPQTPAALADLKPGDVIVRVNQNEVKSSEDFSKLLSQAGSGEKVELTIKRPDVPGPISVGVTLGGSFAPFQSGSEMSRVAAPSGFQFGIQAMALAPKVAAQMGAQNGLIVIALQPNGAAARGGIREGDIIESIDGRIVRGWESVFGSDFSSRKKHTIVIVRDREKKQITLETND